MSDSPTPPTPPAVRLARVALPDSSFEVCPNPDYAQHTTSDGALDCIWKFNINSLDDLALAERRVREAGFGLDWAWHAAQILVKREPILEAMPPEQMFPGLLGLQAEDRAAALIALLDANPELEERLTRHA